MNLSPGTPRTLARSIRDVADAAGVSIGTVSNTINHPERVHQRTRVRVQEAIDALGYVPNLQARVLTGAASNVIGLVVLDVASPFYMETAHALERGARETDHVVMLCNSEGDIGREDELLVMLAAQRVRGILLAPAITDGGTDRYASLPAGLPVVLLDMDGGTHACSITVDNIAGGRLATEHLLALGHRRIAFVAGPLGLRQFTERVTGARQAMQDAGIDPDEHLVEVSASGLGIRDGQRAVDLLLESERPDAIFCGNDMLAFGAYRSLTSAGLGVPDDVALVGYDDIEFASDWVVPLTSVRQPIDELGRLAAELLLEHDGTDPAHVHHSVVLQPTLMVRRSTAAREPA